MLSIVTQPEDLHQLRIVCKIVAEVLDYIQKYIIPGVSTEQIDNLCHEKIIELGAKSASLGYHNYPKSVCISPNNVACHGIADANVILQEGDIVNVDVCASRNGWYGDSSRMYTVGNVSDAAKRLIQVTYECMMAGISVVQRPKSRLGDIGYAIQQYANSNGYTVVKDFCGHGIGRKLHMEPAVLNFGKLNSGMLLQPGMVFTVEPIINAGAGGVIVLDDGWTVITKDGSLSAQWEHTILITDKGEVEILT